MNSSFQKQTFRQCQKFGKLIRTGWVICVESASERRKIWWTSMMISSDWSDSTTMASMTCPWCQQLPAKDVCEPCERRTVAQSQDTIFPLSSIIFWSFLWPPASSLKIVSADSVVFAGCPWTSTRLTVRRCGLPKADPRTRRMRNHPLQLQQWSAVHVKVYICVCFFWQILLYKSKQHLLDIFKYLVGLGLITNQQGLIYHSVQYP